MTALSPEARQARSAGLRYVEDSIPGITRKLVRGHFRFFGPDGGRITDEAEIARIRKLAIPPAYEHVWISPAPNGHIQATGRDARGRKQYRYHEHWREVRDAAKYESTVAFAQALPAIRERVESDLADPLTSRARVLATVVRTLERTLIRVGNETYARENESYGLTTLRGRHATVVGGTKVRFRFKGKSGVEHEITLDDARLARTVKRCKDLPGEMLFEYRDDDGAVVPIHSEDVNAFLREVTGGDFSAKDFRTWAATVACAAALAAEGPVESDAEAKRAVMRAVTATSKLLGNTPSVCRKSYVHPAVIETFLDERRLELPAAPATAHTRGLDDDERRVLAFLLSAQSRDHESETLAELERGVAERTPGAQAPPAAARARASRDAKPRRRARA